jgi:hypothetical protein
VSTVLVIPSRARPSRMLDCARAATATARGDIRIVCLIDSDEPYASEYHWIPDIEVDTAPRTSMVDRLNQGAMKYAPWHEHVVSIGDDHTCVTEGWDLTLAAAAGPTGIAYGDDLLMHEALPTGVLLSSRIIEALGYMGPPELHHLYVDNFWRDLGASAGCLTYCPDVVIRHDHPNTGRVSWDETYRAGNSTADRDKVAYDLYLATRFASDVAKVRALCP